MMARIDFMVRSPCYRLLSGRTVSVAKYGGGFYGRPFRRHTCGREKMQTHARPPGSYPDTRRAHTLLRELLFCVCTFVTHETPSRQLDRHPPDDPPLLAYIAAMRGHRQAGA